jgi:hypothetical protein
MSALSIRLQLSLHLKLCYFSNFHSRFYFIYDDWRINDIIQIISILEKKMRHKIHNLRSTNPKEYWKIINSGRKQISPNISINVLFDFFKTLNTGEPEKFCLL